MTDERIHEKAHAIVEIYRKRAGLDKELWHEHYQELESMIRVAMKEIRNEYRLRDSFHQLQSDTKITSNL